MTLELEGLCFTYPRSSVGVSGIDLRIRDGELLAVIGDSGSGKTTLLKLIAGFERPQAGAIRIGTEEIQDLPPAARNLGVVFQSYALFPLMSALENVAYPLRVRGLGRRQRTARAMEMLDRVGLGALAWRRPAELSGGQQQRVALARALVFSPRALLLDEPLSALDERLRLAMRDEIRRLQKQNGITTVHVTHDQEEALSIADTVAVLRRGRLLQVDTPRNLYEQPANAEVARFVGRSNLLEASILDDTHVRTALGVLRCQPHGFANGLRVAVLIRPEKVRIVETAEGVNAFPCRVSRDRFLGPLRRLELEIGSVHIEAEAAMEGSVHAIAIPPEAVRVLPP